MFTTLALLGFQLLNKNYHLVKYPSGTLYYVVYVTEKSLPLLWYSQS